MNVAFDRDTRQVLSLIRASQLTLRERSGSGELRIMSNLVSLIRSSAFAGAMIIIDTQASRAYIVGDCVYL